MVRKNWRTKLAKLTEDLDRSGYGVLEEIGKSLSEQMEDGASKDMIAKWMADVVRDVAAVGEDVMGILRAGPMEWTPKR